MASLFAAELAEGRKKAMIWYAIEFAEMLKQMVSGNPRHIVRWLSMRSYAKAADEPELAASALKAALACGIEQIECLPGHERFRLPWGEELCAHCIRDEQGEEA